MVEQRSPKPLVWVQLLHPLPVKKINTARVCGVFCFALLATDYSIGYLVLPFNFDVLIPEDDSVRLLSHILEGLNYNALYQAYSSTGRKPAAEPKILFKVLTYAYMNNLYSSRKIEVACKRDINFMWLLEGCKAPDHSTIARFRKGYLKEAIEGLFFQLVKYLPGLAK